MCLFHVNFTSFLFSYFEVLESLIFFLSFWGSSNFLYEVFTRGERGKIGYLPFF